MSPARIVATALTLSLFAAGCADTDDDVRTSEEETKQASLSVAGDGMDPPSLPTAPQLDVPLLGLRDSLPRPPAPRPPPEDLRDPLGPKGDCTLTYLALHDPIRGKRIEVPIVVCN